MAQTDIKADLKLEFKITLQLTLPEAMALNEMVKYGTDAFLAGYYKQLGKSYMQPHEPAVRTLFNTIKSELPKKLYKAKRIIEAVNEIKEM